MLNLPTVAAKLCELYIYGNEPEYFKPEVPFRFATIRNGDDSTAFIKAAAEFSVTPFFNSADYDHALLNKIWWIPCCITATEIPTAKNAGCCLIKLFP